MARHAVIMCGGAGTRLWPLSRKTTPKQFRRFVGERTLIQQTFDRIVKNVPAENIWVMTGAAYVDLVKEQLIEINPNHIVSEPMARNTTAAAGLAMLRVLKEDPEAFIFGVLPADHHIGKPQVFNRAVEAMFKFLEKNAEFVGTIGINPTRPDTALGYIKMGEQLNKIGQDKVFKVDSFHEKPDLETAKEFVEQWEYLWNGGYYLFKGTRMVECYQKFVPEVLEKLEKFVENPDDNELFKSIDSIPIDKAISEKLDTMAVIPADMEWSDIGYWSTLHEILSEGGGEIKQVSVGNHIGVNTNRSLIMGGEKLIATVGLDDIVVIDTEDAILIASRDAVQDVKKIVEKLEEQERHNYL